MFSEIIQVTLPKLNNVTRLFYNAYKCCGSEIQKSYNYRDGLSLLLYLWLPITEGECYNGDKCLEVSCLPAFLMSRLGWLQIGLSWECLFSFTQGYGWVLGGRVLRRSIPRKPGRHTIVFVSKRYKSQVFTWAILCHQSSQKNLKI